MYEELILSSIRTIINQFRRKPDNFFNEHDFHHYFYHVFYSKKEFSRQYQTADREIKKTNILHPEYPTLNRFHRKPEPRLDVESGTRARYDMAILNPEFIKSNEYKTIRCRDIKKARSSPGTKNLIAAIEFKYIIRHNQSNINEIQFDNIKLQHADEAEQKFLLVFTNTRSEKIDYFDKIALHPDIKAAYIFPAEESKGKKLEVDDYPGGWLNND